MKAALLISVLVFTANVALAQAWMPEPPKPPCVLIPQVVAQTVHCLDNRPNCGNPVAVSYGRPVAPFGYVVVARGTTVTLIEQNGYRHVCTLVQNAYPFIQHVGDHVIARDLRNGQAIENSLGQPFGVIVTGGSVN